MKATRIIFSWHHWCGLFVGIFLLMMSVTGAVLVFSDEIETFEERDHPVLTPSTGTPSFDASFNTVQARYPDWEMRLYQLPKNDEPLVYDLRKKESSKKVFVHPVSGEIISIIGDANVSLQRQLLLFHYTLSSGTTGKVIVFINGCLFLITLITGVIVYRRSITRVLTFKVRLNRKTTRSYSSSLHRIIGVWSLVFNLLLVSTGLWLSGQIALTALKAQVTTTKPKKATGTIKSIDAAVALIYATQPGYEIHQVRIRPGGNTLQVSGRFTNDPAYYGNFYSTFTINGETMQIEKSQFMKNMPFSQRIQKMAAPLHFGNYGGIGLKIVYCLFGLTPAFLSISGFVVWIRRGRSKKKRAAAAQ
jgi:uncharacterized iron-regulated membrane protein